VGTLARIFIDVYGCSANMADWEMAAGLLREAGHSIVPDPEGADASVVLTCTVKTPTETKVVKRIKELSEGGGVLVVAGCMPKAQRGLVAEVAPDASMMGPDDLLSIVDVVESALAGVRVEAVDGGPLDKSCLPRVRRNPVIHIAPIASGCLGDCSYCIVKHARGRLNSFPSEMIVEDARHAIEGGCREIWVTAEDTASYRDGDVRLPGLLDSITGLEGRFYVRVGMMTPNQAEPILDDLIDAYRSDKVFKFLHVPVQSGNDEVLRRMNRRYTVSDFTGLVARFREAIPDLSLSTDIICGFPGETEGQFADSVRLVEEIGPDALNISRFWPRPGTEAAELEGQLHGRETKVRSRELSSLWRSLLAERNRSWVGWEGEAVIDEEGRDGTMVGRNLAYKPIVVKAPVQLGDIVTVKITEARGSYLLGEHLL
jgi:threonylcarbamoyladenosine tRNA methylthiotransferase CDKAL1